MPTTPLLDALARGAARGLTVSATVAALRHAAGYDARAAGLCQAWDALRAAVHAERLTQRAEVIAAAVDAGLSAQAAVELAATPNHHHIPGTSYNWRHEWHPLNVQTALLNHKNKAAEKLFKSGAPHAAPEKGSFYRTHPLYPKTIKIGEHGGITPANHLELLPAKRTAPLPTGSSKIGKAAHGAPQVLPSQKEPKAVQAAALQKAVQTGKTQFVSKPGTHLVISETKPATSGKHIEFTPAGQVYSHTQNGGKTKIAQSTLNAELGSYFAKTKPAPKAPKVAPKAPAAVAAPTGPRLGPVTPPTGPRQGPMMPASTIRKTDKGTKLKPVFGPQLPSKESSGLGPVSGPAAPPKAFTPSGNRFTPISTDGWQKIGGQKGSNPGGTYADPNGTQFYIKQSKTPGHARNEALASELYQLTGVDHADIVLADHHGHLATASKLIPGAKADLGTKLNDVAYMQKVQSGFAVDAWLGNWDVAGANHDNIVSDAFGNPVRVDPGGALLYRAQGAAKGNAFGNTVGEWTSLRDGSKNPQSKALFAGMTDAQMKASAQKVLDISPAQIDAAVDKSGFDKATTAKLKTTLKARRLSIAEQAGLTVPEAPAKPKVAAPAAPKAKASPKVISAPGADGIALDTTPRGTPRPAAGLVKPKTGTTSARPVAGKLSKKGAHVVQAPAGKYAVGDKVYVTHPTTGQVSRHEITSTGKAFPVKGVDHQYHYLGEGKAATPAAPTVAPTVAPKALQVSPENAAAVAEFKTLPDLTPDPHDAASVHAAAMQKAIKTGKTQWVHKNTLVTSQTKPAEGPWRRYEPNGDVHYGNSSLGTDKKSTQTASTYLEVAKEYTPSAPAAKAAEPNLTVPQKQAVAMLKGAHTAGHVYADGTWSPEPLGWKHGESHVIVGTDGSLTSSGAPAPSGLSDKAKAAGPKTFTGGGLPSAALADAQVHAKTQAAATGTTHYVASAANGTYIATPVPPTKATTAGATYIKVTPDGTVEHLFTPAAAAPPTAAPGGLSDKAKAAGVVNHLGEAPSEKQITTMSEIAQGMTTPTYLVPSSSSQTGWTVSLDKPSGPHLVAHPSGAVTTHTGQTLMPATGTPAPTASGPHGPAAPPVKAAKLKNPPTKAAKGLGPTNKALYNAPTIDPNTGSNDYQKAQLTQSSAMQKAIQTGQTHYVVGGGTYTPGTITTTKPAGGEKYAQFSPDGSLGFSYGGSYTYSTKPSQAKAVGLFGLKKVGANPAPSSKTSKAAAAIPSTGVPTSTVPSAAVVGAIPDKGPGTGQGLDSLHANIRPYFEGTPEGDYIDASKPGLPGEQSIASHYQQTHTLPSAQKAAVNKYQGSYAYTLNGLLRTDQPLSQTDKAEVAKLDAAAASYALPETVVLNRGLSAGHFPAEPLEGKVLQDAGYMSTSFQSGFQKNVMLHMVVPKGTTGIPVAGIGHDIGEGEFLLPRGTQMVVSKDVTVNGVRHVTGTVVPAPVGTTPVTGVVTNASAKVGPGAYTKDGLLYLQTNGRAAWMRKYGSTGGSAPRTGIGSPAPALVGVGSG